MKTATRFAIARTLCRPLPPLVAQKVRALVYPFTAGIRDNLEVTVRSLTGSAFTGRTGDFHAYPFSVHGYSEWRNIAIALALTKAGDTILEIGANVGTETIGFSDIVGARGRVVAFEPLPTNVVALQRLIGRVQHANVDLRTVALSDRAGEVSFVVPRGHESGMGHVQQASEKVTTSTVVVQCATLDSQAGTMNPPSVIFMDTEGEELRILNGGRELVTRAKPVIVLEASPHHLRRSGFTLNDLHTTVRDLGYVAYAIGRFTVTPVDADTQGHCDNWICVPRERVAVIRRVNRSLLRCGFMPCVGSLNPLRIAS